MKICLINPPQILNQRLNVPVVFQPLGLLYIAAVLEKEYSVTVIDAALEAFGDLRKIDGQYFLGLTFDEIGERVRGLNPDVVGISVPFSVNLVSAIRVASKVKDINRKIITVLGGVHPTVRPYETLALDPIDFIIAGEGEVAAAELMKVLNGHSYEKLKSVLGVGYKDKDKPILNRAGDPVQDLDSLPFPARHLLPMEKYFKAVKVGRAARNNYIFNDRWATVITSRGCPYNCNFCSIHGVMGRAFRPRTPENVMDEIRHLIELYGIRHINFEDDNLTLDKKRAEQLFDLMIKDNMNITWSTPNGIRADAVDENLVMKMKRSGCKRVFVAPESGVQRVVTKIIGKNLDLKKVEASIRLFRKHRVTVDGSFVIGFIGETKKEIWKTIKYALRLEKMGLDSVGVHIATPYYGTALYRQAKQNGFLRDDINDTLFVTEEPLISTPEWSIEDIRRIRKMAVFLLKINYRFTKKVAYLLSGCLSLVSALLRHTKNLFPAPCKKEKSS